MDVITSDRRVRTSWWLRAWRGMACWATFAVTPFGWLCYGGLIRRMEDERLERGLVLVFTGIEGRSFLNVGLMSGLIDGGIQSAVEIVDWTTGYKWLALRHLRCMPRNLHVAKKLAARLVAYQDQYPGRPVWIVGHSGGGGMALMTAAAMPEGRSITGLVLIAAAVSPQFDFQPAMEKVETSIWNYYSWLDTVFLEIGALLVGTMDGPRTFAAGAVGLKGPAAKAAMASGKLIQVCWNWRMLSQFHPGGHFGCVNRVFIAEEVAPLIVATEEEASMTNQASKEKVSQ